MSRSLLAPGVEVVDVPGRGLAVRTADGEFLSVRTRDTDGDTLLSALTGADSAPSEDRPDALPEDRLEGRPGEELHRLVAAFEKAGYLAAEPRSPQWPTERRDIRLLGAPVLTRPLAAHLAALGAEPRTAPAVTAPDGATTRIEDLLDGNPAAVVWCLDGPVPDGLWDAADRLPEHGVAWLRCHREGWQAYVEPLAALPGDVTSAHVRARRLAATPAHRELTAYWNGPRTSGEPVRLTVPAAALLAALLADDLSRWATGTPDTAGFPARRRLRHVDLRTSCVTEYPVLPVPAAAPMPRKDG
ncbi:hypothetical protein [Streptomyces sp. NPDC096068]|uniref:hypothetical protein n=1 Tax=Streptomyces sp. NPDC096068 TaxID=3155424 RepID=UPI003327E8FE